MGDTGHDSGVRVLRTLWTPGERPVTSARAERGDGSTVWLDLDGPVASPELVFKRVALDCAGLGLGHVEELLDVDEIPESHAFPGGIRHVSPIAVSLYTEDGVRLSDGASVAATDLRLVLDVVEILQGPHWVLTRWNQTVSRTLARSSDRDLTLVDMRPSDLDEAERQARKQEMLHRIEERWSHGDGRTAGDLATLILLEVSGTYRRARRVLHSSLESWETRFFRTLRDPDVNDELFTDLVEIRVFISELARRIAPVNPPRERADKHWFSGATPAADLGVDLFQLTDDNIDRALADLRTLGDRVRSCFDLFQARHALLQTESAKAQEAASQRLQRGFELVAAVVVIPTLIASVYGANTQLPLGGTWGGFFVMLGLMVLGALLSYAALHGLAARRSERSSGHEAA